MLFDVKLVFSFKKLSIKTDFIVQYFEIYLLKLKTKI